MSQWDARLTPQTVGNANKRDAEAETENTKTMTIDRNTFNPQELCSRKLWQIVTGDEAGSRAETELRAAVKELASRRHYLAELAELGQLDRDSLA